ncbi:MAG TPA: MATE family efflux transporter [Sphingomonas sp.]|jgi:MATE family multidrug resistance protein|uniref:MATE family efflux transporter n=1 Tax=Sphingomonas sp. TaxID=28214 RepID=UPI002ED8B4FB
MAMLPSRWSDEARRLTALAWPVALTSLNWTLMHLIDVAIVGRAGVEQMAALAASRSVTFVLIVMGLSALVGILVFTARADGAHDRKGTGGCLRAGLLYAVLLGLVLAAILYLAGEAMLRAAGVAPALVPGGGAVVRAMAAAMPAQLVLTASSYFLEGISTPRRVTVVNLAMLPANAVLAWAWVGGHLGLPALGAVGAAHATATVSMLGAAALLGACWTVRDADSRGLRDLSPAAWMRALRDVPAMARFGVVPALTSALELIGFAWLIVLSTRLGDDAAAGFQAMFSLHNLAFATALGFGSAAGVRVGNAVGAGEPEQAAARTAIAALLAALAMGMMGAIFFIGRDLIVPPLSAPDPAAIRMGIVLVATLAPFMLFDGIQLVLVYALRSLGDQVAAGINGVIAYFLVTGGLGWWLYAAGWGAPGLAIACGGGMVAAAILQGARFVLVARRMGVS